MNQELKEHINNALKKGCRLDGRKNDEFRELTIKTGVTSTAEGSALVKCGETEVMVGIKLSLEKPFPDTPDEGILMVGAELSPLANPNFESGPPGIQAIETARVIDRGIRECRAIDTKALCLQKGEKVWTINADICPLNHDGDLIDLGGLAVMAALNTTKLPEVVDGAIDYKNVTSKGLPIKEQPVPVTIVKIGDNMIVDPTEDEESVLETRLTLVWLEDGQLCAAQKGGDAPLTLAEIERMIDLSFKVQQDLRKKLK